MIVEITREESETNFMQELMSVPAYFVDESAKPHYIDEDCGIRLIRR